MTRSGSGCVCLLLFGACTSGAEPSADPVTQGSGGNAGAAPEASPPATTPAVVPTASTTGSGSGGMAAVPSSSGGAGGAPVSVPEPSAPVPANAGGAGPPVDAGAGDDGETEAGTPEDDCGSFEMPSDCTIPDGAVLPGELRCTGLYSDWESRTFNPCAVEYAPAHALWSDGSVKRRFAWVPSGEQVDVSDPDDFRYPLGTRFWKEFRAPTDQGERLLETRLLERVDGGWLYTSYVWTEDESNAIQNNDGVGDLYASGHTVPSREQCKECHSGRPDYVLGWDGILLGDGATGVTRELLASASWVTWQGKDEGAAFPLTSTIPGDDVERAALGYLHSNCGVSCHNDTTAALALETGFFTRLDVDQLASVQETPTFATGLERIPSPNAPLTELEPLTDGRSYVDLRPLDTEASLVFVRMKLRNQDAAMPRIGTNRVDDEGVALVQAWIESMTEERGYPPAGGN